MMEVKIMNLKKAMVVGGSNGIGLAIVHNLLERNYDKVIVADKVELDFVDDRIEYFHLDLTFFDSKVFREYMDIDTLIITAGFGRSTAFETITEKEIENSFKVNAIGMINIVKVYYHKMIKRESFDCVVMASIAGLVSSPLFSLYAATKAAVCRFIESINIELEMKGTKNRILNVSPGSIKGTKFNGGENNTTLTEGLADEIIQKMFNKEELFIPDYESVYRDVLRRYNQDPHQFGVESYSYKMNSGRMNDKPQVKVGYLSGTFDLFHIGHLNLLKRAKQYCDYLIVGVHKDASHKGKEVYIPFEERVEILRSIRYVDEVIESLPEDMDVYEYIKYDYLFVGSDYKGTERFQRYEDFFGDKSVKIIYFPYTKGTSSTQIRKKIDTDKLQEE